MTTLHAASTVATVLVVDDDPSVRYVLADLMHREGARVLSAASASEALAVVRETRPDLALVDVMMPGGDGLSLCRTLKASPATADLPVILVTARASEGDVAAGQAAGAVDYIKKPFDRDEVRLRVRTHLALRREQHRLATALERIALISRAAKDAIILIDHEGRVAHWNEAAVAMFGYAEAEALGHDLHELVAPARVREAHRHAFGHFTRSGAGTVIGQTRELEARRKDGTEFPVELSLTATQVDGTWWALGLARDVTGRRALETELAHARKLEAVGQLAAGIAHEINTPTQYVRDSVAFLEDAFAGLDRLIAGYQRGIEALAAHAGHDALLDDIRRLESSADLAFVRDNVAPAFKCCTEGLQAIAKIVSAMKEFAHPDQREQARADLNQALANTLTIARHEYKYVADAELVAGDLPLVNCHVDELNQVFLNLIVNAAHAIEECQAARGRGTIVIRTRREGALARVDVTDSGAGIPEALRERVFDPFFTTKPVGKGSGQGLAIARSVVVDKHGGSLALESEVGRGTTFTLRLPIDGLPARPA